MLADLQLHAYFIVLKGKVGSRFPTPLQSWLIFGSKITTTAVWPPQSYQQMTSHYVYDNKTMTGSLLELSAAVKPHLVDKMTCDEHTVVGVVPWALKISSALFLVMAFAGRERTFFKPQVIQDSVFAPPSSHRVRGALGTRVFPWLKFWIFTQRLIGWLPRCTRHRSIHQLKWQLRVQEGKQPLFYWHKRNGWSSVNSSEAVERLRLLFGSQKSAVIGVVLGICFQPSLSIQWSRCGAGCPLKVWTEGIEPRINVLGKSFTVHLIAIVDAFFMA